MPTTIRAAVRKVRPGEPAIETGQRQDRPHVPASPLNQFVGRDQPGAEVHVQDLGGGV